MNASDARELTELNLNGIVIDKYIQFIDERIRDRSELGQYYIINPQGGSADQGFYFWLNDFELKAVRLYYENLGFKWKDYPDPDPGHPCSAAYTKLSWE